MGTTSCPVSWHGPAALHGLHSTSPQTIRLHPYSRSIPKLRALQWIQGRRKQHIPGLLDPARIPSRQGLHIASAGGPSKGLGKAKRVGGGQVDTPVRKVLLGIAVAYTVLIVVVPFLNVFLQAFGNGFGPFLEHLADEDFLHAAKPKIVRPSLRNAVVLYYTLLSMTLWSTLKSKQALLLTLNSISLDNILSNMVKMTLLLALVSVPINTVWGIVAAIQITRNEFPGKTFAMAMLDLPFSISPVVTGLMLVLLYGREGWFSPVLRAAGFNVVFAFPGMALATLFVTLPFVVRELIPILEAMDLSEEEAARTLGANDWQVFWNVTLPNIRWGLLYGLILTNARAMGEFGAVSVISGNIIGRTQTLTLYVESAYKEYNTEAAFSASVLLSFLALITLVIKEILERASSAE